jgi:DnaK suppressor protein
MDTEHYKQLLLQKERELLSEVAYMEGEATSLAEPEPADVVDDSAAAQGTAQALEQDMVASQLLVDVRNALRRIEQGTYGRCTICGRPIGKARLDAVPWTPYCLEDQKKQDEAAGDQTGSTL